MKSEAYIPVSAIKTQVLAILRRVEEQHDQVIITKNGMPKVVLINYEDFTGLLETIEILSDAETMQDIKKGLQDIKAGRVVSLKEALRD